MASDLLSLADASALLGVSSERVRQLVVAGDIPGVRFGNAWAVPRDSIEARRQVSNRRGRPLSARRSWESICSGDVDLSNVARYRNRGDVRRYEMSGRDLEFLSRQDGAIVSGIAAAASFNVLSQTKPSEADLYISVALFERLDSLVAAVPDPLGRVLLRVVPEGAWSLATGDASSQGEAGSLLAPRAAVALDMMESGDPRHWVAAETLVEAHE